MIVIRRLRTGECALFKRIRLIALRESPSAFSSTYESALMRSEESWREQADNSAEGADRATFVAIAGDEAVGITAIYRDDERADVGELLQVWVAPEYRGTSLASDVMHAILRWAKENGFREIIATIASGNVRAQQFYERQGFMLTDGAALEKDTVLSKRLDTEDPDHRLFG